MTETTIPAVEPKLILPLFGAKDQHLRRIRQRFDVDITHRDGKIRVKGEEGNVALATEVLQHLKRIVQRRGSLTPDLFDATMAQVTGEGAPTPTSEGVDVLQVGRQIRPRTEGQVVYVDAIRNNDVVFAIGPAGTGKTYLAVAMAVEALKHKMIRKIVLVRPAVEAGESLGFLPGDMQAKINPYLRPLLDAINEMIGYDQIKILMEQDVIEVVPLAYMRGRTLNEAFIILDEAQNTTISQMKMFLTRMGNDSKIVVSGDPTQTDLPYNTPSGLKDALVRLKKIKGVETVELTNSDIVRHRLVQDIVLAYERKSSTRQAERDAESADERNTRSRNISKK
jgi:phosphate starvation-inducible PhoH-like protein